MSDQPLPCTLTVSWCGGWALQTTGPRDWGFVRSNPRFLEGLVVIPREVRPAELAVFSAQHGLAEGA
jgi:hypothetical protein